jgi:hypothetical protein
MITVDWAMRKIGKQRLQPIKKSNPIEYQIHTFSIHNRGLWNLRESSSILSDVGWTQNLPGSAYYSIVQNKPDASFTYKYPTCPASSTEKSRTRRSNQNISSR